MQVEVGRLFNRYSEPLRSILIFIALNYDTFSITVNVIKIVLSCIAFILNLFHILILSQKQMRSSSVNVLMIGLAISDMIYFLIDVKYSSQPYIPRKDCVLYHSYAWTVFSYALNICYNIVRRLSPWIGVIMAFTRLLVSSHPFNNSIGKMSNSRFAVWSLLISLLVSTLIELDSFGLHEVRADITYVPDKSCGFPKNYSQPIYEVLEYSWVQNFPNIETTFRYMQTVFKYLPTVILPVLTICLVKVLKKIRMSKQRLHTTSNDTTYQTTRLVTFMTGCSVVTEVTTGLLYLASISSPEKSTLVAAAGTAISIIASFLNEMFLLSYSLNSMAHCFITWFLSSQYRNCAKNVFPCLKLFGRRAKTESAPMSFQSTNNRLNGGFASVDT